MSSSTVTEEERSPREGGSGCAALYLVLIAGRPADGGARFDLTTIDEVHLGRGPSLEVRESATGGVRALAVSVPDPRMSSRHARIVRLASGWVLEDLGSKNGSRIAGAATKRAVLQAGSLLELGSTSFLLQPTTGRSGHALRLEPRSSGLETLIPEVARELERMTSVARARVPLLVLGETGTGKELAARAAHEVSGRRGRFVAVNCGALPPTLVEAELFGHRRGAFSGAAEDRLGLVRSADRGTLFLDEIGDLAPPSQAALLRVLQEGEVLPVGESAPLKVDVRVVAATHHDLDRRVEDGRFRADLLARLDGYRVRLPPLRERRADLGLIVRTLLGRLAPGRADRVGFSPDAARRLLAHPFPGNVRELEQALGAALALAREDLIESDHWPERMRAPVASPGVPIPEARAPLTAEDEALRSRLEQLFEAHRGNLTAVAKAMGKDRTQIRRYLSRLGLDPERWR